MLKYKYKDSNCFLIMSNSYEITDKLKSSDVHCIQAYDFETLFRNILINS